jgi:hypothetical protein
MALTVIALSACGSNSTRDFTTGGLSNGTGSNNTGNTGNGNNSGGGGNVSNYPQAPSFDAIVSGAGGTSPSVVKTNTNIITGGLQTSRTLRVKVAPLPAPHMTVAPGWVYAYGCYQVQVNVNGTTQTTQVLRVSGVTQAPNSPCANAPDHQILNFDNVMNGSGNFTITVTNPQYDNCRNLAVSMNSYDVRGYLYYGSDPMYGNAQCALWPVWMNSLTEATITVQPDGYWMDP